MRSLSLNFGDWRILVIIRIYSNHDRNLLFGHATRRSGSNRQLVFNDSGIDDNATLIEEFAD